MESIHYWWWFGFAALALALEILAGTGAFFLWWGMAAVISGILAIFLPTMSWMLQLTLFTVFSIITLAVWFRWWRNPVASDQPYLNQRGAQYIDRVFTLHEPIVNGVGKIHVDDTMWKIEGEDCDAGNKVRVTGVNGVVLTVELVD